jgi:hypothetical protein
MIRIALITIWYPPAKSIAVSRMQSFVHYLSLNSDFHIDVYSIGNQNVKIEEKSNVTNYQYKNHNILDRFKSNASDSRFVHKLKTLLRVLGTKIITNKYKMWYENTLNDLKTNHLNNKYDVVISSYSPEEAHLLVLDFIKNHNVIWIADMRDEMSKNPGLTEQQKNELRKIENEINKYASCITSVSKPILDDFKVLCPNVSDFKEIRNGFDHELTINKWSSTNDNILKIGYFGTFYGDRKPDNFFKSFLKVKDQISQDVEFHFYGVHNNFWIPSELKDHIIIYPGVDYLESIRLMATMDANLLVLPSGVGKGVFSGKIFDYISAKRPILAFVDIDDVAANLILNFNCGYVNDFQNIDGGAKSILDWVNDLNSNSPRVATYENILSLHRKSQIKKLEETILELV